jgi:membrane-associated phospholipid phosphatase
MMKKHALAVLAFAIVSNACLAHAQSEKRLQWNEDWPKFRTIGYALTGASVASAIAVTLIIEYPNGPRWQGGILFDDAVRSGIRAHDPERRDRFRLMSDITLASTIVQVALVDSLIVPFSEGSPEVAMQLTLMNAQAFSLNTLFATLLFKAVARERPLIRDCRESPDSDPLCGTGEYASFPSSHTSTAFTAAGLTCVHHQFLPIYGGAWDGVACAASLTLALATGVFRVVGDRHYATDVIFGAIAGFSLGYIYPWLFHYSYGPKDRQEQATQSALQWSIIPGGTPDAPYGLSIAGGF